MYNTWNSKAWTLQGISGSLQTSLIGKQRLKPSFPSSFVLKSAKNIAELGRAGVNNE
jgi:hypothetical protein